MRVGDRPPAAAVGVLRDRIGEILIVASGTPHALRHTEDDSADIGPIDGAGAHAAGFDRGIESRRRQQLGRELPRRLAGQVGFRVARPAIDSEVVLPLRQHIAVSIDQHGAERVIALRPGTFGHGDGAAQKGEIGFAAHEIPELGLRER